MDASGGKGWGFLRKPALFTPAVGFFTFLAVGLVRSPSVSEPLGDALIAVPIMLVVATIFALIPMIIGAAGLLFVFSVLPSWLVQVALLRMPIGSAIGLLIGMPFAYMLNWIPSATAGPRFDYFSMLVACAVAGGYSAFFYSAWIPGTPPNKSLERTRD